MTKDEEKRLTAIEIAEDALFENGVTFIMLTMLDDDTIQLSYRGNINHSLRMIIYGYDRILRTVSITDEDNHED